jgi:hypothetical protein
MTRNSYSLFFCEKTQATVVAIFVPLLKIGVMIAIGSGLVHTKKSLNLILRSPLDGDQLISFHHHL